MWENIENHKLVLVSNSPRRKELLKKIGLPFEVRTKRGIDETYPDTLLGEEIPIYISREKAQAFLEEKAKEEILIAADTVVVLHNEVMGKPKTPNEAATMLRKLAGETHEVITGVTVTDGIQFHSFASTTKVTFSPLTDNEITYYIDNYKPFDKAGAYGIQEWIGMVGVERIEGSYFNVMGLPVHRLYELLRSLKFSAL